MSDVPAFPYPDFGVAPLVPSPRVTNLSHLHVHTPDLDASVGFFTEIIGMVEADRDDRSVYLRAWGEWMHHSLVLTQAPEPGLECMAFRVQDPAHVAAFAERLRAAGTEVHEVPAGTEVAQGDAIRFVSPGGHQWEIFYDFERIESPAHASRLMNRPLPFPSKGAGARRIDHLNVLDPNPGLTRRWMEQVLGFHVNESVVRPDGWEILNTMAVTSQSHDVNVMEGPPSLHHIAYHVDSVHDLHRAAEIYAENRVPVDAGPGRHGGTQGWFLYAKEPGGNRLELYTGAFEVFDPDWKPIVIPVDAIDYMNVWVGQPMSMEFLTTGTASRPAPELKGATA
jgi:catechol 2,3 dioxygenase